MFGFLYDALILFFTIAFGFYCIHASQQSPEKKKLRLWGIIAYLLAACFLLLSVARNLFQSEQQPSESKDSALIRISVSTLPPLVTWDLFSSGFVIQNDGPIDLTNVRAFIFLTKVIGNSRPANLYVNVTNSSISFRSKPIPLFVVGERTTVYCPFAQAFPDSLVVTTADVQCRVFYQRSQTSQVDSVSRRFTTRPNDKGYVEWIPIALSQP